MDFNQILLFTSLGLLVLVMLFALWGFLAGLKRELKCTVVFLVLLVLAWLVFGNSGILLNLSGGLVDTLRSALNLPQAEATVWETIIDFLKSIDGLNLEPLLVEGKETYNLIYNIASAVVSFVLLMGATLVVVIITPIIRLITHVVGLIIQGVKKKKTDNQSENGPVEEAEDPEADDVVLVLEGDEKTGNAVVTLSENKLPPKQKTKQRIWGAVTGALKAVFLLIVLFAPLSGIYSIVKNVSPSTRDLISDLVTGEESGKTNTSESTAPTDVVFDFIDAYGDSGIGKFVESSGYFFGNSFSTLLFDSMANITTERQHIKIREELVVYIKAVNELNGNLDLGTWSNEEIERLLDTLKDSKLLPELMPVLIEYASEVPTIKEALAKAVQESAFLTLRNIDWDKDIEKVLDALKHVYALDLFPLEDLNVLTLDAKEIEKALSILGETEFVNQLFPIVFKTAVKLDAVEELIGVYAGNLPVDEINWQKELVSLAKIYAIFQEYGYTDLEQITNASLEELVSHLVVEKYATTVSVLEQLVEMAIFTKVVIPVGQSGLNHFLGSEDSEFKDFDNIIKLTSLTVNDWKEDFTSLVEIGKLAVEELNAMSLDLKQMDITSDDAILAMQTIVEKVLTLNILGDDQTKNDLLMAVFKKFELFNEEDLYYVEYGTNNRVSVLDKVNWQDVEDNIGEITTIKNIIACFGRFANLESVDIANFEFNIDALLDDEDVVDILVDVLEELVDSELVMQLLNPAVNKYVLPITDQYDDDHLIKDIINEIGPGTAVEEIAKILSAFRSAQNLGLFKVASQGLDALEYQKEDDIHNIINTIFDSKLFEGYEGRIIRIVLKATKLLDVEKGLLNDLDYTNEQDILNGFIYILNGKDLNDPENEEKQTIGILNDPDFKLTDEEGNLYIDLEYLLQPDKFDLLMSGLELILGTFKRNENQEFVEQNGSNLITTLLPDIYQSYIKDLIPDDFVELVELLGVEDLTGEELARDIRRIVYIARQLVEMDVQTLFIGEPIKYTDKLDNLYNIIDALLDVEMFKPNDSAIFAWIINYVGKLLENTLVIEEVTPEQFEDIDWDNEGSIAKEVITDIVKFLEKNDLTTTDELLEFINNVDYLTTDFVTEANADALINILQKLVELKTLESLSPVFFQALVNRLVENEFIVDFWEGELTGTALMDDLKTILDIALIAVDEIGFVELWRDDFEGTVAIPEAKPVNKIVKKLFNLNLFKGYENQIIEFALNKFIPEDFPIDIKNIDLSSVDDWDNEVVVIQTLITNALAFLENNDFILISDIFNFDFADTDALLDFLNADNTNLVANIVESISTSKLVGRFLEPVVAYVVDEVVEPMGYELFFLKNVKDAELLQDVKRVSTILRAVANHSSVYDLIYPETDEFENVELSEVVEVLKTILVEVGNFNILNNYSSELLAEIGNELLIQFGINDLYVSSDDFSTVVISDDFVILTQIIDILNTILEDNEVTTVGKVIAFKDEIVEDFTVLIENNNVINLAEILEKVAEIGIVKSILPVAVEYGTSIAEENNFDISFVKNIDLTGEELANDIICIAQIIVDLVELHAIELYRDEIVHEFDKEAVADVVDQIANMNIFNKAKEEWAAFVANYVFEAMNVELDEKYTASNFANVNWQQDKEYIKSGLVDLVVAAEILFNETSGGISVYAVTNFIEYQEYLDEGVLSENVVINLFNGLGNIVSVDVIDVILPEATRYGLMMLADANIELLDNITIDLTNFAIGEVDLSNVTAKELGELVTNLGAVVNAAISFGAVEYINTQDINNLQLAKLNPALEVLGNTPFITKRINGILALITNIVSTALNLDVNAEAADFGVVNVQNGVTKLCEVLINADITLETLELESLQEVIEFVGNIQLDELLVRENIEETIRALVNTLRPLFEIEVIQTVLPKITNCLLGLVSEQYNLEFLRNAINNGKITGAELADDVSSILDIVDLALDLDAIGIYNYFEFEEDDVEINFDIIVTIIDKIQSLNILKVDYNNWALFISNLFDESIELSEFDFMTDESWNNDFETLKEIVRSVAELLKANDLLTINSIIEFIENETYITYKAQYLRDENAYMILDIVEEVTNINMLDPILTRIVNSTLTNYVESGNAIIDIEFVLDAISNEQYVGKDMKADVKDLVSVARDLVAFGALDYYCFGEIEVIDTTLLAEAVEKLETLKLYGISKEQWLIVGINELYKLLEIETINTINNAYVEGQFTSIAKVIKDLGPVLDYLDIVSTNDLMEMIENEEYLDSKYYTDVTLNSIIDVLEDVTNIPVLNVIALSLASWGAQSADIDGLEFLVDALEKGCENEKYATYSFGENSPLTSIDLVTDLKSIVSILRNAVDFGIADILYNIRIEEINSEYLENIVRLIANLNVYTKLRSEWLNYGLGLALEQIDVAVTTDDFYGIKSDEEAFVILVKGLCDLAENLDIRCLSDLTGFFENKDYLEKDILVPALPNVETVLTTLVSTNIVNAIYDKLLAGGIELVDVVDISFLEGNYTNNLLVEDIHTLVNIVEIACDFGVLEIIKTSEIDEIKLEYVVAMLEEFDTLNLYNIAIPEWLTLGLNQAYQALGIEEEVYVTDFEGLDTTKEIQTLISVVNTLDLLMIEFDLSTYSDIEDFINNQKYLELTNMTDVIVGHIIDVVEDMSNLAVLEVSLSTFVSYALDKANIEGIEFFKEALVDGTFTHEELVADIKVLVDILRNAVQFGILDVINDVRLEEINSEYLENIVSDVVELNVYSKLKSRWLSYGLGKVLSKIDVTVEASDFYGIKSDEEAVKEAVVALCNLVEQLDIRCKSDLTAFIENKDYLEKDILVPALPNVETVLTTLVSTNIVNAIYDKLLAGGIELVDVVDISFLEGNYTNNLLVEDIHTLVNIVEIACDFGVLEIIKTSEIDEIKLEYVVAMLEEFDTLNLYNIAIPEWLTLGLNQAYQALGIEEEVYVTDFEGLDTTKEIQTLISVVKDLDVLMDDYALYTYTDIEYFIKNKEYLRDFYMTDVIVGHIIDVVEDMSNLAVLEVSLSTFVSYALDKANIEGIEFFKEALVDGTFTHEELVADIKVLVDILRNAVQFGILDVINDVRLEEINSEYLENIVSDVVELNVYSKLKSRWLSYGLGKVLSKIDVTVEASDFYGIKSDEEAVKEAVVALCNLVEQLDIRCKSDLTAFIENKDYYTATIYTDENLSELEVVLTSLIGTNIVNAIYDKLLARGIELVDVVDISFLEGNYTNNLLVEDIHSILVIVKNLVEFGIFEYRDTKTIEVLDMTYIKNVVSELENLNMYTSFRPEWVTKVLSRITPKLGFDVTEKDFETITETEWKQDNESLQVIVMAVNDLIDELGNPSLSTLINYYKNLESERNTLTTDSCLDIYGTILSEATTLNVVNVLFPNVLVYAIEKFANYGLDVEFLNGELTLAHVHEDIDNLVAIAKSLRDFGMLEIYYKNTSNLVIDVTILNDVIVKAGSLEIYSIDKASWVAALINCVASKASFNLHMEASDFSSIDWVVENQLLQEVVNALNTLLVNAELREYDEIVTTVKETLDKVYNESYLEIAILEDALDVMEATASSQIVQVMIPLVVDKLMNKVVSKGYDVAFVLDTVSDQELVEDVFTSLDALRDLVKFNFVKIWLMGEYIDYEEMSLVYSAINKLSGLNIVTGNENELVKVVFERHGVNTDCLNNGVINASDEAATLIDVLEVLVKVFKSYNLYTMDEVLHYNYKDIRFDDNTDSNLNAIADILEIISNDNMFEIVVFALSERYVGDKYSAILDIHNIYNQYSQLYSDMVSMVEVIRILADLHIGEIKDGTLDYPFNERNDIETIIRNISTLNYFNLPGRMTALVSKLDALFPNNGIGDINGENINLAADAEKFVEMYESFADVTDHPDFPILNRKDFNSDINFGFLKDKEVLKEIANIVNVYMDTTVYSETGPVVLVVLLPIVKKVLPEYWTALDLDNYTIDKINHDAPLFNSIIETVKALGIGNIINGEVDFNGLDESINSIIDDLTNLELLNGHVNDLTMLLFKDFVYGKEFFGYVLNEGTLDIENIEFEHDAQIVKEIIVKVFEIMKSENITSLSEVKSYISNFSVSTFLKNEKTVKYVADILELVADTTFAQFNAKAMYEMFALPKLDSMSKTQYADYRNATNEEIIADLIIGADIIRNASTLGLGEVMTGGEINYDQADTVQEILRLVGQLNIVKYSANAYINYLSRKFKGLETYEASYETLDVAHELELIGLAYAEVAKALDNNFAYRTLAELKEMTISGLVEFAKNNGSAVLNAVDYLAQMNVAPYLLPTAVEVFNSKTQGTILSDVLATVNPYELTLSELSHDVDILVDLLHNILDSDILSYVLNKSGEILSADTATSIINNIMDMYLLKDQYAAIIKQLFANVGVDISGYDLESVDYEAETEILTKIISEVLLAVDEYGLTRYEEIRPELAHYKSILVNEGKVAFIKAVRDALVVINAQHIMKVIELVDESEFVDRAIISVYNKVLNKYVPEKYRTYLSIEGYTTDDVAYDTHLVTLAIRSLYDSEIYKLFTTHEHVGRECVPYVEDAIRYLAQLRIVDMKKQDFVLLVGEVLGKDFSSLDVSNIDIEHDAEILINAMDDIYTAFMGTNKGRIRIHMLGDTPTMEAIIKVLDAMLSTDTAQVVIPWAVQNYVIHRVKSVVNTSKLDNVTDAKILSICNDSIDALYALLEMGAFSNNGIDLTNKELTDRVFNVVYNNINLGKYQKYFDKFTRNIALYGVLSVDYSVVSTSHEKDVAVETLRMAKALINKYGSQIKSFDINLANDAQFEADVTNIFKQLLKSQLVSQVFIDVINGTSKVATENHGQFAIFEGMTNDEFVNVALPDIFDIVGLVADLGFRSGSGINYKDTDTIMKLVRKVVESPITSGHLDALLSIALNKVANIDIDKQVFKDADIDYNKEADYLEAFLNGIDLTNIDIKKSSSFKSDTFLSEFSVAGKELLPSKVMRIVIKPVMVKAIDKVGSTNAAVVAIRSSLDDPNYSNDDAMNDYEALLEIAGLVSGMGIFTGIDFDRTDNLGEAVEKLFATKLAKGNEKVLMNEILKKITFVDTTNIDLDNVSDWDYEIEQFTNMLDALTTLCKNPNFNVNDINASSLNNDSVQSDFVNYVAAASTTYVGSEIFKELYKTKVIPVLPSDAQDIINIDTLPNEKWAEEIEELFEIYNLVGSNGSLNASSLATNEVLELYDIVFGLNGKDGIESVKQNRKAWLKKFINEETMLQGTTASLEWDNLDDNDQAAQEAEVIAIRAFLENVINGYVDNPETSRIKDISYDNIVVCKDYNKLYGTFIAMSKSVVMRGILIGTIQTGVDKNSKDTSVFNLSRMLSSSFKAQVTNGYDESLWSDEQYLVLAILLASANAFDLVNNANIFTMDLGTAYNDVKSYKNIPGHSSIAVDNFPSQEASTASERGVGFRQLLQLISLSNVFDINSLAGKDGIIDELFSFDHIRDLGTVSNWDEEIKNLTDCFVALKNAHLFEASADIASFLANKDNDAMSLLKAINNSEILRPVLAEKIHDALVSVVMSTSTTITETAANIAIKNGFVWLHKEWEYNNETKVPVKAQIDSKTQYEAQFAKIVGIIQTPSLLYSGTTGE